jgi:hypothetical protein
LGDLKKMFVKLVGYSTTRDIRNKGKRVPKAPKIIGKTNFVPEIFNFPSIIAQKNCENKPALKKGRPFQCQSVHPFHMKFGAVFLSWLLLLL